MASHREQDTICALATPRGAGAIGILRLSGPLAIPLVQRASRRERAFVHKRMTMATLRDDEDRVLDRAMICAMYGPNSFTGDDLVEIYGHGGVANMERLVEFFSRRGARLAEPGEFTKRAFLKGKINLMEAEAVAAIVAAEGDRALENAQALLDGKLGVAVRDIRERMIDLMADLEACIDFSDDIDAPVGKTIVQKKLFDVQERVGKLVTTYRQGRRLNGISVALVGPVNAGKSSLFNALLGEARALVSSQAGTTRDYIEATVHWEGVPVTLIDTAGHRSETVEDEVEAQGIVFGLNRVALCDVVVLVLDCEDVRIIERLEQGLSILKKYIKNEMSLIVALNKIDILDKCTPHEALLGNAIKNNKIEVQKTSNSILSTIDDLKSRICLEANLGEPKHELGEKVYITEARQHVLLKQAQEALSKAQGDLEREMVPEILAETLREGIRAIDAITGSFYSEDVLTAVFRRFCIGK